MVLTSSSLTTSITTQLHSSTPQSCSQHRSKKPSKMHIKALTVLIASGLLGSHAASPTNNCQKVDYQTFMAYRDSAPGKPIQGSNGIYAHTPNGCIYTDTNHPGFANQRRQLPQSFGATRPAMLGGQVTRNTNTGTSLFTKGQAKEAKCGKLCKVGSSGPPNGSGCEEPCSCEFSYTSCQNWHCSSFWTCKKK